MPKKNLFEYKGLSPKINVFLNKYADVDSSNIYVLKSHEKINKLSKVIISFDLINNIRYINKFFEHINNNSIESLRFIFCVETLHSRKKRIRKKFGYLYYIILFFEFVFHRFIPRIKYLRYLYFNITKGKNRIFSKAETLGRVICCGFDIVTFKEFNGILYVVCDKKRKPTYDKKPSYGPIFKMSRIGKNNKIIGVYKIRTMHPYSEYLQDFMFQNYKSQNGDKIINDFRISSIGRFLRKYWIDEIPMLINLIFGDLKIVGVRPLSKSKFRMYSEELKELRVQSKPGLIPPFYVDLPEDFNALMNSELNYIKQYSMNPIVTDLKYFYKAIINIFFKGARSK